VAKRRRARISHPIRNFLSSFSHPKPTCFTTSASSSLELELELLLSLSLPLLSLLLPLLCALRLADGKGAAAWPAAWGPSSSLSEYTIATFRRCVVFTIIGLGLGLACEDEEWSCQ
jgi:hypothetical protein